MADRGRGRRAGRLRLPPVHSPAHGNGRAGGAVRAAMGAGVRPAQAVAPGRGRRPAPGAPGHAECAGSSRGAAAVDGCGTAGSTGRSRSGEGVRGGGPVVGTDPATELERWRILGRDTVVLPEVVAVADALLDPVMAELGVEGQRDRATAAAERRRVVLPPTGRACRAWVAGAAARHRLRRPSDLVDGRGHPDPPRRRGPAPSVRRSHSRGRLSRAPKRRATRSKSCPSSFTPYGTES
jgi:hypothetical protein